MKKSIKVISALILFIFLLFALAPWMNNEVAKEKVLIVHPELRGAHNECPEPYTIWIPFGRWVGNCEGGLIISFWGEILFDGK